MACKHCLSPSQQELDCELVASFPGTHRINESPVYVCQQILLCLDCGLTELFILAPELEKLRKGAGVS